MKKVLMIILIVISAVAVIFAALYFGIKHHARMHVSDWGGMINPDARIGEDGEYYIPGENTSDENSLHNNTPDENMPDGDYNYTDNENMLDGDYTYVDNEKLLGRIVGSWVSGDGSYTMSYDNDYQMTIIEDDVVVLSTKAYFAYLQPGENRSTDFTLESTVLTDKNGSANGVVDYCYHSSVEGEDVIYMCIFFEDGHENNLQFKKRPL